MSYVWQRFGCEATRLIRDKKINPWDEKEPIEKEKKRKKGGKAGACKTPVGVTKLLEGKGTKLPSIVDGCDVACRA